MPKVTKVKITPSSFGKKNKSKCQAITKAGTRCTFDSKDGSKFCGKHAPKIANKPLSVILNTNTSTNTNKPKPTNLKLKTTSVKSKGLFQSKIKNPKIDKNLEKENSKFDNTFKKSKNDVFKDYSLFKKILTYSIDDFYDAELNAENFDIKYNLPEGSTKVELEFRYGTKTENSFINGIDLSTYKQVLETMNLIANKNIVSTTTVDYIMEDNVRVTKDINGNVLEIIKKEQHKLENSIKKMGDYKVVFPTGELTKYDVRFGIAYEIDLSSVYKDNSLVKFSRKKERTTFTGKFLKVDVTKVTTKSKNNESQVGYELELELLVTDDLYESDEDKIKIIEDIYENILWVNNIFSISSNNKYFKRNFLQQYIVGSDSHKLDTYSKKTRATAHEDISKIVDKKKSLYKTEDLASIKALAANYFDKLFEVKRDNSGVIRGRNMKMLKHAAVLTAAKSYTHLDNSIFVKQYDLRSEKELNYYVKVLQKFIPSNKLSAFSSGYDSIPTLINHIVNTFPVFSSFKYEQAKLKKIFDDIISSQVFMKSKCGIVSPVYALGAMMHVHYKINTEDIERELNIQGVNFKKCILVLKSMKKQKNITNAPNNISLPFKDGDIIISTITATSGKNTIESIKPTNKDKIKNINELKYVLEKEKLKDKEYTNTFKNIISNNQNLTGRSKMIYDAIIQISNKMNVPWTKIIEDIGIFKNINFDELFNNFIINDTFTLIRYGDKVITYNNRAPKKIKSAKSNNKLYKNWKTFQNQLQIEINYQDKNYDIKLFANGTFNITGCKDIKKCEEVSKLVVDKINNTLNATDASELTYILDKNTKLGSKYTKLYISLINASCKTNLKLHSKIGDPYGLVNLKSNFEKNESIFVDEVHKGLSSDQRPIMLAAPNTRQGHRLVLKLKSISNPKNNLVTVQVHDNGSINYSAKSIDDIKNSHNIIINVLKSVHS